jgi:hypothetical protein
MIIFLLKHTYTQRERGKKKTRGINMGPMNGSVVIDWTMWGYCMAKMYRVGSQNSEDIFLKSGWNAFRIAPVVKPPPHDANVPRTKAAIKEFG